MIDSTSTGAVALRTAIAEQGRIEGSLLKVDGFLNHRVDPLLMLAIGETLGTAFAGPHRNSSSLPRPAEYHRL